MHKLYNNKDFMCKTKDFDTSIRNNYIQNWFKLSEEGKKKILNLTEFTSNLYYYQNIIAKIEYGC